jgi:protein O-GlcNAc transferase
MGGGALREAQLRHREGKFADAEALYRAALSAGSADAEAQYGLAVLLHQTGRLEEALQLYEALLARHPDMGALHGNRAILLSMQERHEEALKAYDRALALGAGSSALLGNRGNALFTLGRSAEALQSFDHALRLDPRNVEAHYNRGLVLASREEIVPAIAAFSAAIALYPDHADALEYRGTLLCGLHRYEEALSDLDRALALRDGGAALHYNRANALSVLKRFEDAAAAAAKALDRDPHYPFARGILIHSKLSICDWEGLEAQAEKTEEDLAASRRVLSPFEYLALSPSSASQRACAEIWNAALHPASPLPLWKGERYHHERIRLAYLSADFRNHPVSALLAGVFEAHDRTRFETFGISFTPPNDSAMGARVSRAFEHFYDVRERSDAEIAAFLREREIDIAVDLTGYTRESRTGILSYRPAPVQVNYLGFPGTLGAPFMDYIIADAVMIPEAARRDYQEQVALLPPPFLPHDPRAAPAAPPPSRHEAGLPESGFVFGCFNGPYKFSAAVFAIWMRLLKEIPDSVLWLSRPNDSAARNLKRAAAAHGVDPGRVIFAPYAADWDAHIARLGLIDLFLDTSPYGAHTTTSDALWAGVPVLTFPGASFAGRVAASLLTAAGIPELIAADMAEYEARALALARDAAVLTDMRRKVSEARVGVLFDAVRYTGNLERLFTLMAERSAKGQPPAFLQTLP